MQETRSQTALNLSKLVDWYRHNGQTDLPWRQYQLDDMALLTYRVWLAEILLQQTQVARVIPVYTEFLDTFPRLSDLAAAPWEAVLEKYRWMGYYGRARRLMQTAEIVCQEYDGVFPPVVSDLRRLPGVGAYTADAICAFAYDLPVLPWDTNVQKIFQCYYGCLDIDSVQLKSQHEQQMRETGVSARLLGNACMDFSRAMLRGDVWLTELFPEAVWDSFPKQKVVRVKHDADILCIILHKDRKVLYSSLYDEYQPFLLPWPDKKDHRNKIRHYFLDTFGLEVSVRPVAKRVVYKGQKVAVCFVQILLGEHEFSEWDSSSLDI